MDPSSPPPVVHIVEDDASVRDALAAVLVGEGFRTKAWADGLSFLNDATLHPFDIVVLDLNLPGLTGTAVAEELRQRLRGVRIITISGITRTAYERAISIISPVASFRKPIDPDAFVRSMRRAVADATGSPSAF